MSFFKWIKLLLVQNNNKDEQEEALELLKNIDSGKETLPEVLPVHQKKESIERHYLHTFPGVKIYINRFHELGWEIESLPAHASKAFQEFVIINSLINLHLNRLQKKKASRLLASRFYYCLTAKHPYEVETIFKDVRDYTNRGKGYVKKCVVESPRFAVYISKNHEVDWWYYKDIPEYMIGALDEFESLKGLASTTLPKSYNIAFMNKMASALANAFNKGDYDLAKDCFNDVRSYLSSKAISFLKLKAFLISLLFSTIFLIASIKLSISIPDLKSYFIGMGAGVIGAMVSSLQRNRDISLDNYAGEFSLYCESLSKLIIGSIFGCFIVFGTNSELFLAPFKNNLQAIVCFCFISGFVERFVPDLIDGVVRKNE